MTQTQEKQCSSMAGNPVFQLKTLGGNMKRLAELEAKLNEGAVDQELLADARMVSAGLFRIVVMGEIKKGKSSFINALLGLSGLVPVHSNVATSTIFKIHYGPEVKYKVYFRNEEGEVKKAPLAIEVGDLHQYGTEDGNPSNVKKVDFIKVEAPSALLRNGVVLVDTPGVGGLFKEHREITYRHAPNADAIFFLTDSVESPIGAEEVKFLKDLRQITEDITFVQTKSSKADGKEALQARMKNNIEIVTSEVGLPKEKISYFIVDSKDKLSADADNDMDDLKDSGYLPLMRYLNNSLRKNKEIHLARSWMPKCQGRLQKIDAELLSRKQILDADSEVDRQSLMDELGVVQKKLEEWEQTRKPELMKEFRMGLVELKRHTDDKLNPLRSGGAMETRYSAKIDNADTIADVQAITKDLEANLSSEISKVYMSVGGEVNLKATKFLNNLSKDFELETNTNQSTDFVKVTSDERMTLSTGVLRRASERDVDGSFYEDARTTVYGGAAGVMIASVAGGIVGSVIPVIGTIAGSWAGIAIAGIWGASAAHDIEDKRKVDALKRESIMAVERAFASAIQNVQKKLNELIEDISRTASEKVNELVLFSSKRLVKQRNDINARQRSTQADVANSMKLLQAQSAALSSLKNSFAAFEASIPSK